MASQISRKNGRVKKQNVEPTPPTCNCQVSRKPNCPVPGKCTATNVCYHCRVEREDNHTCKNYAGMTAQVLKTRIGQHLTDAKKFHPVTNKSGMSKLSQHVGGLIFSNIPWSWHWDILCHAKIFSPISERCDLCVKEKYYILYHPELASLNIRSELFSACRHKDRFLLIKQPT